MKKGRIVSDEPGYYEDGNFGVRIENLLEVNNVKPEDKDPDEMDEANKKEKQGRAVQN